MQHCTAVEIPCSAVVDSTTSVMEVFSPLVTCSPSANARIVWWKLCASRRTISPSFGFNDDSQNWNSLIVDLIVGDKRELVIQRRGSNLRILGRDRHSCLTAHCADRGPYPA